MNSKMCPVCFSDTKPYFFHPDGQILQCPKCTHSFTDPSAPSQELYNEAYFHETHRNWFRHPNTHLFRQIRRIIISEQSSGQVLDVGCGRGDFLFYLEEHSPSFALTGIDLAPLPVNPRIDFISLDLFSWQTTQTFTVVTSLAVIEHVPNILSFFSKLRKFVKKGGLIVLMTLNSDSCVYAAARAMYRMGLRGPFERLYSRHHRHHFTRRSLRSLVEDQGMEVLRHFTHNFPLAAVDFPSRGVLLDMVQYAGVSALFGFGNIRGRGFLQTLVCRS